MPARDLAPRTDPPGSALRIAGMTRFSASDWPGRLVATVFLQGCPWDCFYCHNPALIDPRSPGAVEWGEVAAFLRTRRGLLDGLVFSGGEPTMQAALPSAMADVRGLGFGVGLHTAGAFPSRLARILPLVDWVGIDAKAEGSRYAAVTGRERSAEKAARSLAIVLAAREARAGTERPLDVEVRTTAHPEAIDGAGLGRLGADLAARGAPVWALQTFRTTGSRAPQPQAPAPDLAAAAAEFAGRFERVVVR
jgi:pyruvate formate lyase activating enzyme